MWFQLAVTEVLLRPWLRRAVLYFCASWAKLTSQRLTQPSTGNKLPAGQNIKILCLQAPTSSVQIVAIQIFKEHFLTVLIRTMKFTLTQLPLMFIQNTLSERTVHASPFTQF